PAAASLERVVRAYGLGNADEFNKELVNYRQLLEQRYPAESGMARLEGWFNHFEPFYVCMVLYVGRFLLVCLSCVTMRDAFASAAFWLAVLAVVVHTLALALRMYIQGRPPVTNLYSSAVFIGWGCVLLCIGVEWGFRRLGRELFGLSLAVGTLLLGFP